MDKVDRVGEMVYNGEDDCLSTRRGQSTDKIHSTTRHKQGMEKPSTGQWEAFLQAQTNQAATNSLTAVHLDGRLA